MSAVWRPTPHTIRVVELVNEGLDVDQIASRLGISTSSVMRAGKRAGVIVPRPKSLKALQDEDRERVLKAIRDIRAAIGYPAYLSEIQGSTGLGVRRVAGFLWRLERAGKIRKRGLGWEVV